MVYATQRNEIGTCARISLTKGEKKFIVSNIVKNWPAHVKGYQNATYILTRIYRSSIFTVKILEGKYYHWLGSVKVRGRGKFSRWACKNLLLMKGHFSRRRCKKKKEEKITEREKAPHKTRCKTLLAYTFQCAFIILRRTVYKSTIRFFSLCIRVRLRLVFYMYQKLVH